MKLKWGKGWPGGGLKIWVLELINTPKLSLTKKWIKCKEILNISFLYISKIIRRIFSFLVNLLADACKKVSPGSTSTETTLSPGPGRGMGRETIFSSCCFSSPLRAEPGRGLPGCLPGTCFSGLNIRSHKYILQKHLAYLHE